MEAASRPCNMTFTFGKMKDGGAQFSNTSLAAMVLFDAKEVKTDLFRSDAFAYTHLTHYLGEKLFPKALESF